MNNISNATNTSDMANETHLPLPNVLQPVVDLNGPIRYYSSILLLIVGLTGISLDCITINVMLRINQYGEESKSDRILRHITIADILANFSITLPGAALFLFFKHTQDDINIRYGQALFAIIASVSFLNLLLQNLLSIDRVSVALKKGNELIPKEKLGHVLTAVWSLAAAAFLVKVYWVLKVEDKEDNFFNLYGFDSTPSASAKQHAYISIFANGTTSLVVVCSFVIVHFTLIRQNRLIRNMQNQGVASVTRRKQLSISKIATVIGLVTLVTLLPWEVYRIIRICYPPIKIDEVIPFVYIVYCLNYSVNPIIYMIMVKRFREEVKRWTCCYSTNITNNGVQLKTRSQKEN